MPWVAVGVLIVVGSALAFAVTATHLGSRQPVLAVTKAVPAGGVIRSDDLAVLHLSADARLHPMSGTSLNLVIGRTAAVPLAPGTILTSSELGPPVGLGAGRAAVGVAMKSGQYPPDIAPGQTVRVVDVGATSSTGGPASASPTGETVVFTATVISVAQPAAASTDTSVVELVVPDSAADQVAALAAASRIALVEVPPQP